VVGGETYLWKAGHRHLCIPRPDGTMGCGERFHVSYQDHPRTSFQLDFPWHSPLGGAEYIERRGVVVFYDRPTQAINLNLPRIAAKLITSALEHGWSPKTQHKLLLISDGFIWMRENNIELSEQGA
jgi:hypothetical protein